MWLGVSCLFSSEPSYLRRFDQAIVRIRYEARFAPERLPLQRSQGGHLRRNGAPKVAANRLTGL